MMNHPIPAKTAQAFHIPSLVLLIFSLIIPAQAYSQEQPNKAASQQQLLLPEKASPAIDAHLEHTNHSISSSDQAPATLPHKLSPLGMFDSADPIVKSVMIGLAIASLLTWTIFIAKSIEILNLRQVLRTNVAILKRTHSIADKTNTKQLKGSGETLIKAAEEEFSLSSKLPAQAGKKAGIKERLSSKLTRIEANSARDMLAGTGLLATIGAISPFVGLFGTVWGIMNSFIGISQANTSNLAVVAPGIAEALLATALGLVAAIPAVVIYNHFSRQIAVTRALNSDCSAIVMQLISRDLDSILSNHTEGSV